MCLRTAENTMTKDRQESPERRHGQRALWWAARLLLTLVAALLAGGMGRAAPSRLQPVFPMKPPALLSLPLVPARPPVTDRLAVTLGGAPVDLFSCPGWRVVYFWSAACPCVSACERYSFVPLAKKYKGKVSFFAVASGGYDLGLPRPQLSQTIAARRLPFRVLLDPQHGVAKALGARVTPQAFLLDPQGRVVFSGMPDDSRRYLDATGKAGISRGYLARALTQALAGRPVTQPEVRDQGCIITW